MNAERCDLWGCGKSATTKCFMRIEPEDRGHELVVCNYHATMIRSGIRLAAPSEAPDNDGSSGVDLIAAERQRQLEVEGWTADHDDSHTLGQMAIAAACYALQGTRWRDATALVGGSLIRHILWPWDAEWFKPTDYPDPPYTANTSDELRIRDLTKAGALIAAEIDRLLRASGSVAQEGTP